VSDPTVIKSRLTPASNLSERTSRPSRPESTSQLPGTFFTSPGFILGIVIVELVYGFVLFIALSGSRKAPPREITSSDDELALQIAAKGMPIPPPRLAVEVPKEKEKAKEKEADRPTPIKEEATQSGESKSRQPKEADTQTKSEAPKVSEPLATSPDSSRSKPEMTQKPGMPVPPAHQVAMNIRPEPPKVKIEEPRVGPIGPLIDLDRDCKVSTDEEGFTIETPGKPHIITPEQANAPRALEKVTGDFVAEVHVPGEIRPGVNPLKQYSFTFQGAGLLLWLDQENYIRLERTVMYEAGSRHQVMVESFKGGKRGRPVNINVKGDKITLRMERHGGEINCTYSSDRRTWLPVRRWAAGLPPTVLVGVSASNISPKPFEARFTDFSLKHAGR
jgi:regulation of enolase protein 1 (concanavalin A-like superfamily)